MLTVSVRDTLDREVAIVRITEMLDNFMEQSGTVGHYSVEVAVSDSVGEHLFQRTLHNVDKWAENALGVLRAALDTLPEEAFHDEGGEDCARLKSVIPSLSLTTKMQKLSSLPAHGTFPNGEESSTPSESNETATSHTQTM